jgi:hypothetical protein
MASEYARPPITLASSANGSLRLKTRFGDMRPRESYALSLPRQQSAECRSPWLASSRIGTEGERVASGVIGDADEHVTQVVEWIDAVQLAGGDERVEDAGTLGAFVAAA